MLIAQMGYEPGIGVIDKSVREEICKLLNGAYGQMKTE